MAWFPFQRRRDAASSGQAPKESYVGLQFETDGFVDIWLVNRALIGFDGRAMFPWHLSIIIAMGDVLEIGIPTKAEQQVLGKLGEELSTHLKANGNGLFVASGTWNGERQLLYRIRDPEVANRYLTDIVANPSPVRPMEYRMEKDAAWVFADKYLEPARLAPQ